MAMMEDPVALQQAPIHLDDGSKSCKSTQPSLSPFYPDFPEADLASCTIKNTFLHVNDDDDDDDEHFRGIGRIFSAPTKGTNALLHGGNLNEHQRQTIAPMKVKRVLSNGDNKFFSREQWPSECVLEEADGSTVDMAWNMGSIDQSIAQEFQHQGENDTKDMDTMGTHSTLSTIQEMFSQMYSSKSIPVKNSFVHYNDADVEDRNLKKFRSAPVGMQRMNKEFSPVCAAIMPMPPVPESYTRSPGYDADLSERFSLSSPSASPSMSGSYSHKDMRRYSDIEESRSKSGKPMGASPTDVVAITRPWETSTKVPIIPDMMKKTRPPPGMKFLCTFVVGINECPQFTVSRRIIGRGGENMKFISQLCTGTKLRLRGKGSGFRERDTNAESDVPLQVNLSSPFREEYELSKREMSSLLNSIYREYKRMFGKEIRVKLNEHPKNPK